MIEEQKPDIPLDWVAAWDNGENLTRTTITFFKPAHQSTSRRRFEKQLGYIPGRFSAAHGFLPYLSLGSAIVFTDSSNKEKLEQRILVYQVLINILRKASHNGNRFQEIRWNL